MRYVLLFVMSIMCCVTRGDIVYLSDGTEIEGITRQAGDRIIVEMRDGQKKSFSESDVLYIAKGPLRDKSTPTQTTPDTKPAPTTSPAGPDEKTPQTAPADNSEEKNGEDLGPVKMDSSTAEDDGKLSQCAQSPADMLYDYLRRKATSPSPGIEDLIRTAKARLHDHMYRIGTDWVKPEDFERRRQTFEERLAEAEALYKEADKLDEKDKTQAKQKQRLIKNAQAKLAQAAQAWQDPLTRRFLMGVAAYNSQDYAKAVSYFYRCTKQAPWVSAFWQGLGDALMGANRHENAMHAYTRMIQTTDDKSLAIAILRDALQKIPGTKISQKPVIDAKKFIGWFPNVKPGKLNSQRQSWLFPGKTVTCRPESLPVLPFDTLTFRQGIAIPITPQLLLVGADIVKDADTVMLRLRDWLYVTAKVELVRDEPVAILQIPSNIKLMPVKIASRDSLKRNQYLTAIATDISPAMSTKVRDASVTVKSIDTYGTISVSGGLMPGEGTSPVLDSSGGLAGFLAGKLDTDKDTFPDRLLTIDAQSPIAKKLVRVSRHTKKKTGTSGGMPIEGQTFVVFALETEKLENK